MYASDNDKTIPRKTTTWLFPLTLILLVSSSVFTQLSAASDHHSLGKPATHAEIQGWDIDVRADGFGLPDGYGTALQGEDIFLQQCASCHGEFAEGAGRYPALAGGIGSLNSDDPVKTVGSYWPYAPTLFDYIYRAMPFGNAQSLDANEVYALTAYILYSDDLIEEDFELNQTTLAAIEMPNRHGFIEDSRPAVTIKQPCMKNCLKTNPIILGRARQIDVTPETTVKTEQYDTDTADPKRGEQVFAQCSACHSMTKGENKLGPHLHAILGRRVGSVDSFTNYSAAMQSAQYDWSADNLRAFLIAPQSFLPGTSMPFGGIQNETALADLLAFFQSQAVEK